VEKCREGEEEGIKEKKKRRRTKGQLMEGELIEEERGTWGRVIDRRIVTMA